jgi:hypothetical protein
VQHTTCHMRLLRTNYCMRRKSERLRCSSRITYLQHTRGLAIDVDRHPNLRQGNSKRKSPLAEASHTVRRRARAALRLVLMCSRKRLPEAAVATDQRCAACCTAAQCSAQRRGVSR